MELYSWKITILLKKCKNVSASWLRDSLAKAREEIADLRVKAAKIEKENGVEQDKKKGKQKPPQDPK